MTRSHYSVVIPILRPTNLPLGYYNHNGFLRTFVFTLSPRVLFYRLITIIYTNKNIDFYEFIRPGTSFPYTNEKKGGGQTIISSKEIPQSPLGSLCIQVYRNLDGTLAESYMWKQSGMIYSIEFPKGIFSQEEIDRILSSMRLQNTSLVCLLKIVSNYLNIPCDPRPFISANP